MQYTPFVWLLLLTAALAVLLALSAWHQRKAPGARAFAVLMLLSCEWAAANALEIASADLGTKLFWANVQYLAYVGIPPTWLVLALQYAGLAKQTVRRRLPWLLIVPAITLGLVWTNPMHGLIRRDIRLDTSGPFSVVVKTYGPGFWLHTAYSYLLMAAAAVIFAYTLYRATTRYRGQVAALLIGLLLPLTANALYVMHLSPIPRIDPTPVVFILAGTAFAWALRHYGLFDLAPVARSAVVDSMADPVLVLDKQDRIVDLNPAAARLFVAPGKQAIGESASELFKAWPELCNLCCASEDAHREFPVRAAGSTRFYHAAISQLAGTSGATLGRIIVLHDVSERMQFSRRLVETQENERRAMARELHDEAGQLMTSLLIGLNALQTEPMTHGSRSERVEELKRMADSVLRNLHNLAVSLRPASLDRLGLEPALRQYADTISRQKGLQVQLLVSDAVRGRLPTEVETTVYRVVQEALTNVARHAQATQAAVVIERRPGAHGAESDELVAIIEDNGAGFDPVRVAHGRLGLVGMHERAEVVGGTLTIESEPGRGTAVYLALPWPAPATPGGNDQSPNPPAGA